MRGPMRCGIMQRRRRRTDTSLRRDSLRPWSLLPIPSCYEPRELSGRRSIRDATSQHASGRRALGSSSLIQRLAGLSPSASSAPTRTDFDEPAAGRARTLVARVRLQRLNLAAIASALESSRRRGCMSRPG